VVVKLLLWRQLPARRTVDMQWLCFFRKSVAVCLGMLLLDSSTAHREDAIKELQEVVRYVERYYDRQQNGTAGTKPHQQKCWYKG
jgi:hypothetical protein